MPDDQVEKEPIGSALSFSRLQARLLEVEVDLRIIESRINAFVPRKSMGQKRGEGGGEKRDDSMSIGWC